MSQRYYEKTRIILIPLSLLLFVSLTYLYIIGRFLHLVVGTSTSSEIVEKGPIGEWKCCLNPQEVNPLDRHPDVAEVQLKPYQCPDHPSNFSWYYSTKTHKALDPSKWTNRTIYFVGGSTTRQMYEQLNREMPHLKYNEFSFDRFLFSYTEKKCCMYQGHHKVDISRLAPNLHEALRKKYDYIIINIATWWSSNSVGHLIDEKGQYWLVNTSNDEEWRILNKTTNTDPPDVSFAALMDRLFRMVLEIKSPKTTLVWRSESFTDCPVGSSFRGSISPVLRAFNVPVLNISEATCQYGELGIDNSLKMKPHLCFPSVALRHWLLEFQDQFL